MAKTYKSPIDLVEKEYQATGEKIRKNYLEGKELTEGVDTERFDEVKKKMSEKAKGGKK